MYDMIMQGDVVEGRRWQGQGRLNVGMDARAHVCVSTCAARVRRCIIDSKSSSLPCGPGGKGVLCVTLGSIALCFVMTLTGIKFFWSVVVVSFSGNYCMPRSVCKVD